MSARKKSKPSSDIVGAVDDIGAAELGGWVFSQRQPSDPVRFVVTIDGEALAAVTADLYRGDVHFAGLERSNVGFRIVVPARFLDGKSHQLEFFQESGEPLMLWQASTAESSNRCLLPPAKAQAAPLASSLPAASTASSQALEVLGHVDGFQSGGIRGWAVLRDLSTGQINTRLKLQVYWHAHLIAQLDATLLRFDVAEALNCEPHCGFLFVPPPDAFAGKTLALSFRIAPGGHLLPGSPCSVAFPDLDTYRAIRELDQQMDRLFVQMWQLRASIKALLPAPQHNLQSYHRWATSYFKALQTRKLDALPSTKKQAPSLVTIICTAEASQLADLKATIDSVIGQTHQNWELLLLVGSGSQASISALSKLDKRILLVEPKTASKPVESHKAGLLRGKFLTFLDAGSILFERALEILLHAAQRADAKFVYCDDDELDESGFHHNVRLKPDWNYRLLLAQNYIGRSILLEQKALIAAVSKRPLASVKPDYDLLLQLAETLQAEEIHHVPEILYHRSSGSAASQDGDVDALVAHLERRGLAAEVSTIAYSGCHKILWSFASKPKVSIVIPFREQVDMTSRCVEALFSLTDYPDYEVILVDNGSTSSEASAFVVAVATRPNLRVIRVDEPFNFSRLNNIAVAQAQGEFVVFMNNDILVSQTRWLIHLVGEAMVDESVAVVGAKLLYPNGSVQHAGVILGVDGVGDHAHRALAGEEPGYMGRAISAQELNAVTAACMLCRRQAFDQVGGFDEIELQVAYNDVDLCLKLRAAGYKIIFNPASVAIHVESFSRGSDLKPENHLRFFHEAQVMQSRWKQALSDDVFYNRNFSRRGGIFQTLAETGG